MRLNRLKSPILVRIDDVSPYMDKEKFDLYVSGLYELGIKPMLGVIPETRDASIRFGHVEDFWNMISTMQKDGYEIAMHGVHHTYTSQKKGLICDRPMSEFAGLPYEKQKQLLNYGRNILEAHGIVTDSFFAPGHSYDRETVRALSDIGFKYVSDGKSWLPYNCDGIKFIPATAAWKLHFGRGILTICLHPSSDGEKSYNDVIAYLAKNINRVISFDAAKNMRATSYFSGRIIEYVNMTIDRLIKTAIKIKGRKSK